MATQPESRRVSCPKCGKKYRIPASFEKSGIRCSQCRTAISLTDRGEPHRPDALRAESSDVCSSDSLRRAVGIPSGDSSPSDAAEEAPAAATVRENSSRWIMMCMLFLLGICFVAEWLLIRRVVGQPAAERVAECAIGCTSVAAVMSLLGIFGYACFRRMQISVIRLAAWTMWLCMTSAALLLFLIPLTGWSYRFPFSPDVTVYSVSRDQNLLVPAVLVKYTSLAIVGGLLVKALFGVSSPIRGLTAAAVDRLARTIWLPAKFAYWLMSAPRVWWIRSTYPRRIGRLTSRTGKETQSLGDTAAELLSGSLRPEPSGIPGNIAAALTNVATADGELSALRAGLHGEPPTDGMARAVNAVFRKRLSEADKTRLNSLEQRCRETRLQLGAAVVEAPDDFLTTVGVLPLVTALRSQKEKTGTLRKGLAEASYRLVDYDTLKPAARRRLLTASTLVLCAAAAGLAYRFQEPVQQVGRLMFGNEEVSRFLADLSPQRCRPLTVDAGITGPDEPVEYYSVETGLDFSRPAVFTADIRPDPPLPLDEFVMNWNSPVTVLETPSEPTVTVTSVPDTKELAELDLAITVTHTVTGRHWEFGCRTLLVAAERHQAPPAWQKPMLRTGPRLARWHGYDTSAPTELVYIDGEDDRYMFVRNVLDESTTRRVERDQVTELFDQWNVADILERDLRNSADRTSDQITDLFVQAITWKIRYECSVPAGWCSEVDAGRNRLTVWLPPRWQRPNAESQVHVYHYTAGRHDGLVRGVYLGRLPLDPTADFGNGHYQVKLQGYAVGRMAKGDWVFPVSDRTERQPVAISVKSDVNIPPGNPRPAPEQQRLAERAADIRDRIVRQLSAESQLDIRDAANSPNADFRLTISVDRPQPGGDAFAAAKLTPRQGSEFTLRDAVTLKAHEIDRTGILPSRIVGLQPASMRLADGETLYGWFDVPAYFDHQPDRIPEDMTDPAELDSICADSRAIPFRELLSNKTQMYSRDRIIPGSLRFHSEDVPANELPVAVQIAREISKNRQVVLPQLTILPAEKQDNEQWLWAGDMEVKQAFRLSGDGYQPLKDLEQQGRVVRVPGQQLKDDAVVIVGQAPSRSPKLVFLSPVPEEFPNFWYWRYFHRYYGPSNLERWGIWLNDEVKHCLRETMLPMTQDRNRGLGWNWSAPQIIDYIKQQYPDETVRPTHAVITKASFVPSASNTDLFAATVTVQLLDMLDAGVNPLITNRRIGAIDLFEDVRKDYLSTRWIFADGAFCKPTDKGSTDVAQLVTEVGEMLLLKDMKSDRYFLAEPNLWQRIDIRDRDMQIESHEDIFRNVALQICESVCPSGAVLTVDSRGDATARLPETPDSATSSVRYEVQRLNPQDDNSCQALPVGELRVRQRSEQQLVFDVPPDVKLTAGEIFIVFPVDPPPLRIAAAIGRNDFSLDRQSAMSDGEMKGSARETQNGLLRSLSEFGIPTATEMPQLVQDEIWQGVVRKDQFPATHLISGHFEVLANNRADFTPTLITIGTGESTSLSTVRIRRKK
ncbi:MAG: hypothetical protein KDA89_11715 [Planctomycetaceae bacterium]|nr:hypothetical protein [Planctomycetaceae bacterium]